MKNRLKRTFFSYQNILKSNLISVYEIAIDSAGNTFDVILTEDILDDGIPCSSKTELPSLPRRHEKTLAKAEVYFEAYAVELNKRKLKEGWKLLERVNDPEILS